MKKEQANGLHIHCCLMCVLAKPVWVHINRQDLKTWGGHAGGSAHLQAQHGSRECLRHESLAVVGPSSQQVLEAQQAPMAHIPLLLLDELV